MMSNSFDKGFKFVMRVRSTSRCRALQAAVALTAGSVLLSTTTLARSDTAQNQSASWVQANDQAGRFLRGHVDILRAETRSGQASKSARDLQPRGQILTLEHAQHRALRARPSLFITETLSPVEQTNQIATVTALMADVQRAWIQAVGGQMLLELQERAAEAAQIGYELAQRMGKVGNWGADRVIAVGLQASAEQLKLVQARQRALQARESLALLLLDDAFELPASLPEIRGVGAVHSLRAKPEDLARERLERLPQYASIRADLARNEASASARALQRWQSYAQPLIEAVVAGSSPLTLFVDRSQVLWTHAVKESLHQRQLLDFLEFEARSTVVSAQADVLSRHAQAMLLGNEMLPLARQAEEEAVYHYNGMFISTWSLLDQYRARVDVEMAHTQAQIDYWDALYAFQAYLAGAAYKPPTAGGASVGAAAGGSPGGH